MPLEETLLEVEEFQAARRCLRVAVVTETYPPEVNGVAMTVARTVQGLQARGHAVQLVRPRQHGADEAASGQALHEVLMRGLPIPHYPGLRMGVPAKRSLVRRWSVQRPDIVHVATEGPLGWSALQAARVLKLPVTSDFRTNFHAYSRHYGVGWLRKPIVAYLRRFHNACACTMVPTEALRADLQACGFERLRVVARGVDTALFDPTRRDPELRRQWGAGPEDCVLLCVGRLAAEKNLGLLADAFEKARVRHPSLRLVLVGDGPMREALQRRLPDAHFAGTRTGADLGRHYASADLFVFASLTETFGNVTLEALSSGLPVVAFDCAAAARFVIPGRQGWLAPTGQPQRFVEAVVEAVTLGSSARRAMGVAARDSLLHRGWEQVVGQFEACLLEALERAEPSSHLSTQGSGRQSMFRPLA
jgi:glycosyltransferase involved in cell wall biosynthesis